MIESLSNEKVKHTLRLQQSKRARKQFQQFVVEGAREISRALSSGWQLDFILVHEPLASQSAVASELLARLGPTLIWQVSHAVFQKAAIREDQDGLLAVFQSRDWQLHDILVPAGENLFVIAIDGVEKPGNFGAILRTADGAGAHAVIALGSGVDPFNPNVIRASLGTVFAVPVLALDDEQFRCFLKERNAQLVVLTPEARQPYFGIQLASLPTVVLFGSEAFGVRELWKELSPLVMQIPMRGIADSLNLSVSVALLCYERLRQLRIS